MSILYEFDEELHNRTMQEIAREKGMAEGMEKGMEKGMAESMEKGMAEGISVGQAKIIQSMLRKQKTPEYISELTEQPIEYVYQVQREMLSVVSEESEYMKKEEKF